MPVQRERRGQAGSARAATLGLLWLVIVLLMAGFGAAVFAMLNRPPDVVALCERGSRIDASTIVLIDTTDTLNEIQRRRVRAAIESERDRLPPGGKLSVVTINAADPGQPVEIVSACNPGQAGDANPLFITASKVDKRWTEAFAGPVEAAIARVSDGAEAASSPIIATVAALSSRPDFDARVPRRRLVVVSDLIEHQKGIYSQLAGGDFWKAYVNSRLPGLVALDLRGVTVAVDYLVRPTYAAVQGAAHRRFWRRLFAEAGASDVSFIGMPPDETVAPAEAGPEAKKHLAKRKGQR